jgi:GTP diphosphokinase / guanosine-3',5'-bis(diphosphate) 3'-diphosphatase
MSAKLLKALDFAAEHHSAQRRKGPDGAPYVNHLIEVAALLANVAAIGDEDVLVSAVLHDVVEDTSISLEEVGRLFGQRVEQIVGSLTDDKALPKDERKRLVLERLVQANESTKVVKLADLCSNIRSFPLDWPAQRRRDYLEWSGRAAALCAGVSRPLDDLYQERWTAAAATLRE